MTTYAYEGLRRVVYGGEATFLPICPKCGGFVKADEGIAVYFEGSPKPGPNATCKKDGRVEMLFKGYYRDGRRRKARKGYG